MNAVEWTVNAILGWLWMPTLPRDNSRHPHGESDVRWHHTDQDTDGIGLQPRYPVTYTNPSPDAQ